jgi:peptidoglycan/LPS O-acetylase OafA/YrhL
MRGIAALAVVWYHVTTCNSAISSSILKASGSFGYLGVAAFFVISGFVIPYSLDQRGYTIVRDGWNFFLRRVIRLEPAYLVSVAVIVAAPYLEALTPWFRGERGPDLVNGALHVAYLIPWTDREWLNPVYWTLAIEFQYYVAILFLVPSLLSDSKWAHRCFLLACAVLPFATSERRVFTFFISLFAMGFVGFLRARRGMTFVELLSWMAAFSIVTVYRLGLSYSIAGILSLGLVLVRWPQNLRFLTFFGTISYSLYLIHWPVATRVANLVARFPHLPFNQITTVFLSVIAAIAAAYFLWRWVENPAIILARRFAPYPAAELQRQQPA